MPSKSRSKTIPFTCQSCDKIFYVSPHRLQTNIKFYKGEPKYCNSNCTSKGLTTSIKIPCANCGKLVTRVKSQVYKNSFCNHSCSATFNNKNKTHGTRRSKLEIHLEERIKCEYPNLEVKYNSKEDIGSEVDFYFPTLRLAVELNGIFHYEPIYGTDKFEKIQNNDLQKQQICNAKGIELAIIDSSSCNYLNSNQKEKYWNILNNLLGSVINRSKT